MLTCRARNFEPGRKFQALVKTIGYRFLHQLIQALTPLPGHVLCAPAYVSPDGALPSG